MKRLAVFVVITLFFISPLAANEGLRIVFPQLASTDSTASLHGDCTILITDDDYVVMIDCGHADTAPALLKVVQELGIKEVDCFIATHQHVDHIGAFTALADALPIAKVYQSTIEYPSAVQQAFVQALDKHAIPRHYVGAMDTIEGNGQLEIAVMWPDKDVTLPSPISNAFGNNNSLVLKVVYQGTSLLLAGDLYTMGERMLMSRYSDGELESTIAKANHHGEATSNQKVWYEAVKPSLVVCTSDGAFDPVIYSRLRMLGLPMLQTAIDGTIVITMGQNQYAVTSHTIK